MIIVGVFTMGKECPICGKGMMYNKYKDVINFEGFYFSVFIVACSECGYIDDEESYIE